MARTCIDWEPDPTPAGLARPYILHVTKVPPSNSGIARHAAPFDRALDRLGPRETIGLPVDAHVSQRIPLVVGLARRVLGHLRRHQVDLVVVDLSGRALAEFFSAVLVTLLPRRRRPALWLVAHDAPELVGAPLLFAFLDRKGGRRIGMALSRSVGRALERWLARHADAILALSELGAQALHSRLGDCRVWSVPHAAELIDGSAKEPVVYCPSGLRAVDLLPTLRAFQSGDVPTAFKLRIGNLDTADRRQVERWCRSMGILDRTEFTGFLDQADLDESFGTATIVVRHQAEASAAANWAAASGPIVYALAAGCALLSTDRRGSRRCVEAAGLDLVNEPDRLPSEISRLAGSPPQQDELSSQATNHIAATHLPEAVARYLAAIWQELCTRSGNHRPLESRRPRFIWELTARVFPPTSDPKVRRGGTAASHAPRRHATSADRRRSTWSRLPSDRN